MTPPLFWVSRFQVLATRPTSIVGWQFLHGWRPSTRAGSLGGEHTNARLKKPHNIYYKDSNRRSKHNPFTITNNNYNNNNFAFIPRVLLRLSRKASYSAPPSSTVISDDDFGLRFAVSVSVRILGGTAQNTCITLNYKLPGTSRRQTKTENSRTACTRTKLTTIQTRPFDH